MVAGFIVIFATDYLIHGVWLMPAYNATKSLWRPDAENECARSLDVYRAIPLRDVLCSYWAKGFARLQHWCRLCGGLLIGLFQEVWVLVDYVVCIHSGRAGGEMVLQRAGGGRVARHRNGSGLQTGDCARRIIVGSTRSTQGRAPPRSSETVRGLVSKDQPLLKSATLCVRS